jgi:4-hydroxyphenylpyruvate dioxygenase
MDPTRTSLQKTVATVCMSGTLDDKLVAASHAGFRGIELFEPDLVASKSTPTEIRRRCEDLKLGIDLYQPFRDLDSTDNRRFELNLRRLSAKFDVMEELGVDLILVCSNASDDAVTDIDELAMQLRAAGELALRLGKRIAYEALAWGRSVDQWQQAWEAVQRADHPAVGLCLDSFHILSRSSDLLGLDRVPGEKIFFLQLADAAYLDMNVLQWSRHYRLFPGEGSFDLVSFTAAVLRTGYTGPLSLEVFNDVFRQSSPVRAAIDAQRSLVALETRLDNVQPPHIAGAAFVELNVTPTGLAPTEQALSAFGFVRSSKHRSKAVTSWTQGDATILVTVADELPGESDSAIAALAVTVDDPTRLSASADGYQVTAAPRVVRAGEVNLPAVTAPDGVSIFFVSDTRGEFDWRTDFEPIDSSTTHHAGVTGIDHISLTAPFDRFNESVLFYRSVLGLRTDDVAEYPGPYGLVRSHMLRAPNPSAFGVALDGPVLRRGTWAPSVQAPQHIAFITNDIIGFVAGLPADAPLLHIQANYYADLEARLNLDPEFVRRLQGHNILYDRSPAGEFMHAYTRVIGAQVYFEIIERKGDYRGRPLGDAPVRMSAHVAERRKTD